MLYSIADTHYQSVNSSAGTEKYIDSISVLNYGTKRNENLIIKSA